MLINLADEPEAGFTLTLDESALDLASPSLVFGEGAVSPPAINAAGGFDAWAPLPLLPPHSTFVIEF